jgi:hypothetical protein
MQCIEKAEDCIPASEARLPAGKSGILLRSPDKPELQTNSKISGLDTTLNSATAN